MDALSNDIKRKKRRIRCLEEFHNLNRNSLSETLPKSSSLNKKDKTIKLKSFDYLPKVDLIDNNKESYLNILTNNDPMHDNDIKKIINDFVVTEEKEGCFPSCNQVQESPDEEIIFKQKRKLTKKCVKIKNVQTNKENLNKKKLSGNFTISKKINNTSGCSGSHSNIHSYSLRTSRENCLESDRTSTQFPIKYNSPKTSNNRLTRKSVRFVTPSPPQKQKRNTFDLEQSSTDISLLPNITKNDKDDAYIYKKSPHVNKLKSVIINNSSSDYENDSHSAKVTPDVSMKYVANKSNNSLTDYENDNHSVKITPDVSMKYVANKSNNSNKQKIGKFTPKSKRTVTVDDGEYGSSQKTPQIQNLFSSVIDLVTPESENVKNTAVSINENKTSNSIITSNTSLMHNHVRGSTVTLDDTNLKNDDTQDITFSKLNSYTKRKKWNKSEDCSFLDNINDISAPWSNKSFELSEANDSSKIQINDKHKQSKKSSTNQYVDKSVNKYIYPSSTSTPLLQQKKVKATVTESKVIKSINKTKMPNFARIHQRAYEKLENIKEMSERKAARAQLLLSGHKPESGLNTQIKTPKSKKELKYSPAKIPQAIIGESKVLVNIAKTESLKPTSKVTTLPKPLIKKVGNGQVKSLIPKPTNVKKLNEKTELSKFGFKIKQGVAKYTAKDQIKAVTQKSHLVSDAIEKRRNLIQNVRSNRRFELLMKMRKK